MSSVYHEFWVKFLSSVNKRSDERRGIYKWNKQGLFSIFGFTKSLDTSISEAHTLSRLRSYTWIVKGIPSPAAAILQLTRSSNQYPNYGNSSKLSPYRLRAHCQSSTSPIVKDAIRALSQSLTKVQAKPATSLTNAWRTCLDKGNFRPLTL